MFCVHKLPLCGCGDFSCFLCRGRFDVWDDNDHESPSWHGSPRESRKLEDKEQSRREREDREHRKEEREQRRCDDRSDRDEIRRVGSATFGPERVLSSIRGLTMDERERDRYSLMQQIHSILTFLFTMHFSSRYLIFGFYLAFILPVYFKT